MALARPVVLQRVCPETGGALGSSSALCPVELPKESGETKNYRGQEREPHTSSGPYLPSPLAILMSRAVRIRAMSVEVKCTVMSSATGMFINTNLCETQSRRDTGETHPDTVSEGSSAGGDASPPAAGFQGVPYMGVPSSLQGVRAAGRGGSSGRGPSPPRP